MLAHTVAATEINGDLTKYLHFLHQKCVPNLNQLVT